jgi:pimeloyl-ACP methyl ester carboxylesterase
MFSLVAERRNPPIECDGVRLHYLDGGDPAARCVVLFHGNGSMIQDFTISGLVDRLARRNRVLCFDRLGFGCSPTAPLAYLDRNSPSGSVCEGS